MPDGIISRDQSGWLTQRVADAEALGPPQPPQQVVVPGAKQAIAHDRLLAHHEAGHDEHAIREHENRRWQEQHAERLAEHQRWVAGPYTGAIEEMRKRAMEAAAEDQKRRAIFEQLMREREEG